MKEKWTAHLVTDHRFDYMQGQCQLLREENKHLRELLKKCVPALEMWTDGAVGLTAEEYCLLYEVREVTK